jgi:uncharacterized damage-inducible protein DinB
MSEPIAVENEPLIAPQLLIDLLDTNFNIIQRQTKGLTHADSLLQLPFRANCLNWVMGHIVERRELMLTLVDEATLWTPEQVARYERNSKPVLNGDDALPFEKILADFATGQERLTEKLKQMSLDDLTVIGKQVIQGMPPQSIGEWLHFLVWHETYHVGQTEILRQLTGVNDKVI